VSSNQQQQGREAVPCTAGQHSCHWPTIALGRWFGNGPMQAALATTAIAITQHGPKEQGRSKPPAENPWHLLEPGRPSSFTTSKPAKLERQGRSECRGQAASCRRPTPSTWESPGHYSPPLAHLSA